MSPIEMSVGLYDHYESIAQVYHYYGVLAIYALCRTAEQADDDGILLDRCRQILGRFPDQIVHAAYNFPSYRIGGIARAYMLHRGHMSDEKTRKLVAHYAEEMMLATRDDKGIISHPYKPAEQLVWIDVVLPVVPYLLFAGLALDRPEWVDESAKQVFLHYDEFMDKKYGLLHQSRGFNGPGRYSEDHWGRGQGWGLIGLTELVQYLPADSPHREKVRRYFRDHCQALLPHQSERGLWRQEVPDPKAWEESSGTGLILYAYGVGMRLGVLDEATYRESFVRGIAALREYCVNDDFSTELCCPGCLCVGKGERKGKAIAYIEDLHPRPDDEHSFAPLMLALSEQASAGKS